MHLRKRHPNLRERITFGRRRDDLAEGDVAWDQDSETWSEDSNDWEGGAEVGDGAGNFEGDWVGIGPAEAIRAEIEQLRQGGGEEIIAAKVRGVGLVYVTVRASNFTRQITTDDRIYDLATGAFMNIKHAPPPARDAYITFLCEYGVTV